MRILLASPESGVWNSRKHIHMGLGYLAGALLAHGYAADIWDAAVEEEVESFGQRLARDPYEVVGISAPTPLIVNAWEAAATAKRLGAITILGGPHLTLMPHESMLKPQVDLVVRGEAEQTIIEIMHALERDPGTQGSGDQGIRNRESGNQGTDYLIPESRSLSPEPLSPEPLTHRLFNPQAGWGDILGLSWRDLEGKIHHNPDRPLADDLDAIPFPAHHLFKIERYTNLNPLTDGLDPDARAYTIVTSRGCPYKCTYCSKPITGDTWRGRSVDNVIAEWRWLVEDLGATEIGITDDIWNLDRERAKALCRALIDNQLNHVPWVTIHGMKVNNTDQELFTLMKAAGCKRVGFGVENGDDWMLRHVIKKGQTVDMVRQAFGWAKNARLQTMGFFIFGMPGETEESMEKTIQLALELDPDLAHFLMAAPFPGTEMWETLEKHGQVFSHNMDWSQIAIQDDKAHFAFGDMDKETVERKWHEAHRRFYLRPRRIARIVARSDTWRRFPYYINRRGDVVGVGREKSSLMFSLLPRLPLYWTFRRFGWPRLLPFSIVVSVSFRCNSKCKTCDVWRKPNDDMTVEEWDRVFARMGPGPLYVTFTGGEPFLRTDTADMVLSACRHCRPSVVTVPTNGILTRRIIDQVDRICAGASHTQIGINLSLDGIGEEHDEIRKVPGNWKKAMETWEALKELQRHHKNLVLTTHTVVSKFNLHRFFEIYAGLQFLEPDSYITEVAEERVELDTVGWNITPEPDDYAPVADFLSQEAHRRPARGIARVTQAFRAEYYQLAKRILYERRQVIPCYAGWASGHIAPNGDVWTCCIRAEPVGNLREHNYDIRPIWFGERMAALRKSIYAGECACPMANASYANMLLHPPTVTRVATSVLRQPRQQAVLPRQSCIGSAESKTAEALEISEV